MGCSTSKLDDEEAVQLCRDRKRFIKQAVEQRIRFATGHLAYIQSLKRVSAALRDYVEGDEPREFFLDSFVTHQPFTPVKKPFSSPRFISISPKSLSSVPIQSAPPSSTTTFKVNYLRSGGGGGNQAVSVEERPPQSPETFQVQSFSPVHQFGMDGFFAMQSPSMNSYSFSSSSFSPSNRNRAYIPPPSPRATSQWDAFWNPFSSLDYYGYPTPTRSSLEQMAMDDEIRGLRQVREEEGIPDLEDETEQEDVDNEVSIEEEQVAKVHNTHIREEEVVVEDLDDTDSDEDDTDCECECEHEVRMLKSQGRAKIELSKVQNSSQVEAHNQEMAVGDGKAKDETPGFTVYVNRRPTSMAEVIKDLEEQFTVVCNSAKEISVLLESSRAQYSSTNHELSAMKMLNPVALFRSASSRSSSTRFLMNSSSSRDESYDSSSDFSEESCMLSGSHQSTLDRLYAWEKKLYEQVKSGERVRIAYEKKSMQLRNHDVKGDDPSAVDKTRMALRDLDTQIKISLHSIEAISKRIETLRDEELHPQLLELVQGLARMWEVMAECHQSQRRTLDEAKLLLAGMPSKLESRRHSSVSVSDPQRLARSAANLQTELRNWRACFESWITSQRSYLHSLKGWLLRCVRSDSNTSKLPFSPRRSSGTHPIFGLCIQWSKFLDSVQEMPVLDGLDFFAAGMGSLYAQQLRDDSHRITVGARRLGAGLPNDFETNMEIIEVGEVEEVITVEKMAEVAIRVLCAGMSVAVSSLTEFALGSAEGYAEIIKQWENAKLPGSSSES